MGSPEEHHDHHYHPQDTLAKAWQTTMLTGGAGLFTSAVQNTLAKQNVGPWGVITRTGSSVSYLAAMGCVYGFVKTSSANMREKEDHWNTMLGGFLSGSVLGLRARSFPAVFGYGATLAVLLGAFDYTGGTFFGKNKDPNVDEFERREKLRTQWRTSGEQTLAELGEGRGIYGPGYKERRAERIKEAYGIEVPTSAPPAS